MTPEHGRDIVRCDGCQEPGRRRPGRACPDFWFFIESKVARTKDQIYVVYACSEACRDKLWRRGPGSPIDEEGSARMRKREGSR